MAGKKITDLSNVTGLKAGDLFIVETDGGTRSIKKEDLLAAIVGDGAGAHNGIYRGKYLGSEVTTEQYEAISSGKFTDLYIGDYWTIGGINHRIGAFDYYLNTGDTNCTAHHVLLVPDTGLYTAQMHNTTSGGYESGSTANTTEGGYVGSDMYKTNLAQAKTIISNAFGDHILKHRQFFTNAVSNGLPSTGAWYDSTVDIMSEQMVYGAGFFRGTSNGTTIPYICNADKGQLPLFRHRHDLIGVRNTYWLRDVVSASRFANVSNNGAADHGSASGSYGVRPAFCIC